MRLLRVIATLDPRHGGPAAGLRAITPALAALGHETTVVTLDAPGTVPPLTGCAAVHALGSGRGGYAYSRALVPWLRAHAARYDAVFVHGLWQYHGRAVWTALRGRPTPYFVFPHGMLDPWFRRAYPLKHVKKWTYWQLCERHVLRDAAAVFFTCEEERRLARRSFAPYACAERVIAYGTVAPADAAAAQSAAWRASVPELGADRYWLSLGRIHPKKGLDLLVRAFGQVAGTSRTPPPALVLAGPCQDAAYLEELTRLARSLPPPSRVIFPGMLEGARKWGALRDAEVFVLPSHQENFGIAVVEALAVGTPVLISRRVNIWEEIESHGAGAADVDDLDGVRRLLHRWQALPMTERAAMRRAADDLFNRRYEISRVAHSLVDAVSPFLSTPFSRHHEKPPAACELR